MSRLLCKPFHGLAAGLLLAALAFSGVPSPVQAAETAMAETDPKAVVGRFWDRVWIGGDVEAIDDLMAEDFIIHTAGETVGPREAFKAWVASFFANIDGLQFTVEDMFADGGKVATRWVCSGKLKGAMFGIEGTGQPIRFTGINLMTVRDGRIVEAWVERDALGLARQLGALKN